MTRFASAEFALVARRVVHRLKRMKASGVYGGDYGHRTCWDEYRFEAENGPTPALDWAWDSTVRPLVVDAIDRVPEHMVKLLSWHLAGCEENDPDDDVRTDLLLEAVLTATKEIALGWR